MAKAKLKQFLSMVNNVELRTKIAYAIELDDVGYITEFSLSKIEEIIKQDHSIGVIPEYEYDAIIVTIDEKVVKGERLAGYVFFDKTRWNRAPGDFCNTTPVLHIANPVDGLQLAYTKTDRYLVI